MRLFIALACAGVPSIGYAQSEVTPPQRHAAAIARVESLIRQELQDKQLPALSIAIVDDQSVLWAKGFGFTDAAKRKPATAETVYRVGSVSKLFTDVAVMQLVEQKKLELDAPITKYLPRFNPANESGKAITLRQLMAHHAGLVREPPVGNYFDKDNLNLADMVASLNTTSLVLPPETKLKYSNAGIGVVGYVLQETQQEPFARYLKRAVLTPLGMRRSAFEPEPDIVQNRAHAIMWTLHGREFPAPTFELGMSPAGSMYSTVIDLSKFLSSLAAGGRNMISHESLTEMWRPQFAKESARSGIGLGFFVNERNGKRRIGHNGAIYGYATELAFLPEEKLGVVVAIACDCANPIAGRIADFALDCVIASREGKPLPELISPTAVSDEWVKKIVGTWVDTQTQRAVTIEQLGNRLWLWPKRGGMRTELKQIGDELMVDDRLGFGTRIRWEMDHPIANGNAWKKQEAALVAPVPPHWKGLIGEYGEDHNVLNIFEWDGRLVALIEWFFIYPLTEESENVYAFPDFGLYHDEKLVFERDSTGRAKRVVAASVPFVRRHLDGEEGKTFKIKPVRQLDGLLKEALAAVPPAEARDFRIPDLVDVTTINPAIKLDIRYASDNNFLSTPFYKVPRAFLQRPAAVALGRAHTRLNQQGYGLLIHDAYRPWYVTYMFREATPVRWHHFVADPKQGSRHNRGCAVDLTLYDLKTGNAVEMVGGYDEFSDRSYPEYLGGTTQQRRLRDMLRRAMEAKGFTVYEAEWWHFDYKDWRNYPILNKRFEDLR